VTENPARHDLDLAPKATTGVGAAPKTITSLPTTLTADITVFASNADVFLPSQPIP
jgi:hypothetical protein